MTKTISAFFDLGFRTIDELPSSASRTEMVTPPAHKETPHIRVPSAPSVPASRANGPIRWVAVVLAICVGALIGMPRLTSYPYPAAETPSLVIVLFAGLVIGGVVVLGVLAALLHYLRGRRNPLYWELACWVLVVAGIVVRQMIANGSPAMSIGALLVAAVVGVAVLPGLMRWLNKISRKRGLQHVAVPFSLGFFLDLAQVLTSHYVVRLPWIPT